MSNEEYEICSLIGKPIEELILNSEGVPTFIPPVCEYLRLLAKAQGIFRVPGNQQMVDDLGILFNLPKCSVPPSATVHDVASFLKKWMISLPVPLISPPIFNEYFSSTSQTDPDPLSIFNILMHLPEIQRKCLAYLFSTVKVILDNEKYNQMSMSNLALCVGNSLTQSMKG